MSWYYVDSNDLPQGPLTVSELKLLYGSEIKDGTFVWNGTSVTHWTALRELVDLMEQLKPPKRKSRKERQTAKLEAKKQMIAEREAKYKKEREKKKKNAVETGRDICSCGGLMYLKTVKKCNSYLINLNELCENYAFDNLNDFVQTSNCSMPVSACDECEKRVDDDTMVWQCKKFGNAHPVLCMECKVMKNEKEKKISTSNKNEQKKRSKKKKSKRKKKLLQNDDDGADNKLHKSHNLRKKAKLEVPNDQMVIAKQDCEQKLNEMMQQFNVLQREKEELESKLRSNANDKGNENEENKCKMAFRYWLCDIANLRQYLKLFDKADSADIRYIEFFDEYTIKNEVGIKHPIHFKFLMKKVNEFKTQQQAFQNKLEMNDILKTYGPKFESNGILTMDLLKRQIKSKHDLINVLQIDHDNGETVDAIWNSLFDQQQQKQQQVRYENEGQRPGFVQETAYI